MRNILIAEDKKHLKILIEAEIRQYGNKCDLNHIDIFMVTDLSSLFSSSKFNGNISNWNTSNVIKMDFMFENSMFEQDISNWDVSKVTTMRCMFTNSLFNKDISEWNISNVTDMRFMFYRSQFNQDLSNWKPYNIEKYDEIFGKCDLMEPYWINYDNNEERLNSINKFQLYKKMHSDLDIKSLCKIKIKI